MVVEIWRKTKKKKKTMIILKGVLRQWKLQRNRKLGMKNRWKRRLKKAKKPMLKLVLKLVQLQGTLTWKRNRQMNLLMLAWILGRKTIWKVWKKPCLSQTLFQSCVQRWKVAKKELLVG